MTEVVSKVSVQNGTHVEIELEGGRKWVVTAYGNGGVELTTVSEMKDQQGGPPCEAERPTGPKLVMMPYRADSIDGLADELTDGGTFTFPGGAETVTRAGDMAVYLYAPGRSVAPQRDIEADPAALTRWLDEEERLNDERRGRLARWREQLGRKGDGEEPEDLAKVA